MYEKFKINCSKENIKLSDGIQLIGKTEEIAIFELFLKENIKNYEDYWVIFNFNKNAKIGISIHSDNENSSIKDANPFYYEGNYCIPLSGFNFSLEINKIIIRTPNHGILSDVNLVKKIPRRKLKLKIMLHSGIGDSLNHLSRHKSINNLAKYFDLEVYWSYGLGVPKLGNENILKTDVLGRNSNFIFVQGEEYNKINCLELFNGYTGEIIFKNYFNNEKPGFEIKLSIEEMELINKLLNKEGMLVGVQLEGNDSTKRWGEKNFIQLFEGILKRYPNCYIFILDQPDRNYSEDLIFDKRIINTIGITNLAQNINIIQRLDLWISPDSFSKYVAHWSNTRQIVLDRKAPYSNIKDGDSMAPDIDHVYGQPGLYSSKRVKILGGIYHEDMNVTNIVSDVKEISCEEVLLNI
jgi:hypothetical protein